MSKSTTDRLILWLISLSLSLFVWFLGSHSCLNLMISCFLNRSDKVLSHHIYMFIKFVATFWKGKLFFRTDDENHRNPCKFSEQSRCRNLLSFEKKNPCSAFLLVCKQSTFCFSKWKHKTQKTKRNKNMLHFFKWPLESGFDTGQLNGLFMLKIPTLQQR